MVPSSLFKAEKILNHKLRRRLAFLLNVLIFIIASYSVFAYFYESRDFFFKKSLGLLFIFTSFRLYIYMAESYFRSYYFSLTASTFEYSRVMDRSKIEVRHPLIVFMNSKLGRKIMMRAGLIEVEIDNYVRSQVGLRNKIDEDVDVDEENLKGLVQALLDTEKSFSQFLFEHGIQRDDLLHVTQWVEKEIERERQREFWWSKERLSRMPKVGVNWAYSSTWKLDKYSYTISDTREIVGIADSYYTRDRELELIEASLGKAREANIMLVGPPGVGKKRIVQHLTYKILTGQVVPHLRFRRVVMFNALFLISSAKEKGLFEEKLISVLNDAEKAKNVVLVIDDFPEFVRSAQELGTDVAAILGKFLGSSQLPLITLSNEYAFHQVVEPNRDLMSYFDKINVDEPDDDAILLILEEAAERIEISHGTLFTFGAIKEIASGAKRYFADGVMPDKALDLLRESASWALKSHLNILDKKSVEELLEEKTKIPIGEVTEEEKAKLVNLEKILHLRVIGQDEAIDVVSDALRRSRADVKNVNRPMGSFLFLGPTGVGKTETAKALAEVFFEGEENLLRMDMSEYQEDDSVKKLIGSFESGKSGTLANLLRSKPYGVLLLDEFEKASTDVHDLFLQIFDEGFFSDMRGRRVNARNIIFVVTSNAGSDLIFNAVNEGKKLALIKDNLIEELIRRRTLKPELLNRFDAVVLFHPLSKEHLERIALLLLSGLAERIREKNIHLVINDTLINTAIKFGYDPKFGAREMRRAIQDKIENAIAEKIIKGEIESGQDLILDETDLK